MQTDKLIPESGDLSKLKILCLCLYSNKKKIWVPKNEQFKRAAYLTSSQVEEIINDLCQAKTIISWNGLGFDLQILYHNCKSDNLKQKIKKITKKHIDLAFSFMCQNGYMLSLSKVGFESNIQSSTVPMLWQASKNGQDLVINNCRNKSHFLINLYQKIIKDKQIEYNTSKNIKIIWRPIMFKDKPLSVKNSSLVESDNDLPPELKAVFNKEKFLSWVI